MKPTIDVLDIDCSCGHVLRVHLTENAAGDLEISTRPEGACQSPKIDWQQRAEAAEAKLARVRKMRSWLSRSAKAHGGVLCVALQYLDEALDS